MTNQKDVSQTPSGPAGDMARYFLDNLDRSHDYLCQPDGVECNTERAGLKTGLWRGFRHRCLLSQVLNVTQASPCSRRREK
jgi:hypothetical protein